MTMAISTILLAAATLAADPTVTWNAPPRFVEGRAFVVQVSLRAPEQGATVPAWLLTPEAFSVDGKPLGDGARKKEPAIELQPGAALELSFDLGPALAAAEVTGDFQLSLAELFGRGQPRPIAHLAPAEPGLDFLEIPEKELSSYLVVMRTNQGEMLMEMWPDVAPLHVRNFLDLSYTGFYDGLIFHRVVPGFMIQGGDPTGTGRGGGPRTVQAEFSDRKHVRGVLSMARTNDPDSATSQFFVVHASAPHLDGSYSAFGKLLDGIETVDRIVAAPRRAGTDTPVDPQVIVEAIVVRKDSN